MKFTDGSEVDDLTRTCFDVRRDPEGRAWDLIRVRPSERGGAWVKDADAVAAGLRSSGRPMLAQQIESAVTRARCRGAA